MRGLKKGMWEQGKKQLLRGAKKWDKKINTLHLKKSRGTLHTCTPPLSSQKRSLSFASNKQIREKFLYLKELHCTPPQ